MKTPAATLLALVVFASCTIVNGNQNIPTAPSSLDIDAFQKSFMSSYYAERAGSPGGVLAGPRALTPFSAPASGAAKATVPVNLVGPLAFASLSSPTTVANYPEPGQTTSFTVNAYATDATHGFSNPVYNVKATTVFPSTDARKSYLEEYYVEDVASSNVSGSWSAPDAQWTTADPIVKLSGGVWVQDDPTARVQMLLTFQDGSARNETIVSTSLSGGPKFDPTAFDVGGSLDLSQAFFPATTTDPNLGVQYSSVVMYHVTPSTKYNYWFWSGSGAQTILGVRYYTEALSGGVYTSHTVSFEKTIGTLTTTGGSFTSTLKTVLAGSQFDTLAESVLRQRVVYALKADNATPDLATGQATSNMRTRVVNIAGKKDFFLSQLNSDNVLLSSWATSTIYIPTGDAAEILAGDSSAGVFTRNQQASPSSTPGTVRFTDILGIGDIATVYASIVAGSPVTSVPNAPTSNLNAAGVGEYLFDGSHVGYQTTNPLSGAASQAGTVEAWVYLNQMTDTAGIVHNGESVDFTDEGYSLQGWGSAGQVAIVLDQPGSGSSYDMVTTASNLNQKKWYYLAATWDTSTKKILLYVNGALSNSGTMNLTASGVRNTSTKVLLGSQLPKSYSSGAGFFSLDGKIVGANVSATALAAATILENYNAYKGSTRNW